MKLSNSLKLIIAIAVSLLAGIIGSVFTTPSIAGWYAGLVKSTLNPPAWVFGPVWTTLYLLIGVAFWLIWKSNSREKKRAFQLFVIQFALNAIWSPIFFGAHFIGNAMVVLVLLWASIVLTILVFKKISRPATLLLVPYIIWVSFALYLNVAIWILN